MTRLVSLALLALLPTAIFAESATPSLGYTGAPTDHGGQDCSTCHNSFGAANSDKSGSLQVMANDYSPFNQQVIRIIVTNSNARRWGFQMTIRAQNSPTASVGTFSLLPNPGPVQIVCNDGTQFGASTGCTTTPSQLFAEHQNAPAGGAGSFEFDVSWIPPAQEVGRIEVYVAAGAADGDGTPRGDRVYTASKVLQNIGVCNYPTLPTLNQVLNGASFQAQISSLSMVSLFGHNFQLAGYPRSAGPGDYVANAFPTELG